MGALPKRRISTRRKGKRRADASKKLKLPALTKCPHCGEQKIYRQLCANCHK
jgi:large subunit ribosomal protein L32